MEEQIVVSLLVHITPFHESPREESKGIREALFQVGSKRIWRARLHVGRSRIALRNEAAEETAEMLFKALWRRLLKLPESGPISSGDGNAKPPDGLLLGDFNIATQSLGNLEGGVKVTEVESTPHQGNLKSAFRRGIL